MKRLKSIALGARTILIGYLVLCATSSELSAKEAWENELTEYLGQIVAANELTGLTVAVTDNKNTLYHFESGFLNKAQGKRITSESPVYTASISKLFTGTAIMQLVENQQLDLDVPINDYLQNKNIGSAAFEKLTARHLLTHTSGLNESSLPGHDGGDNGPHASFSYVQRFSKVEFDHEPGTYWHYSDANFDILAAIVEVVSKRSFENYIQENIFQPLDMQNSCYGSGRKDKKSMAISYKKHWYWPFKLSSEFTPLRSWSGSAGLFSSANDLTKFMRAYLNHGKLSEARVLQSDSVLQMWHPEGKTRWGTEMGLAWHIGNQQGKKLVMHYGGYKGFRHLLALVPEQNIGIVVLSNDAGADDARTQIKNKVMDMLMQIRNRPQEK